jgi:hypothetical protein
MKTNILKYSLYIIFVLALISKVDGWGAILSAVKEFSSFVLFMAVIIAFVVLLYIMFNKSKSLKRFVDDKDNELK